MKLEDNRNEQNLPDESRDFEDTREVPAEPETEEPVSDDVSAYYPDGDAEHMADDDAEDELLEGSKKKRDRLKKKNGRMTKGQIALIAILFVLYTALIVTASWIIFYRPQQPKNGDTPFDTTLPGTLDPLDPFAESTPADSPDAPNPTGETEQQSDGYVPKDGVYNILIVGYDVQANLADVTMLVNCDTTNNKISVMQIPRDTLVTTGVTTNKINAQYSALVSRGYLLGKDEPYQYAVEEYAKILEQSLCVKIHYTVLMSVSGFRGIVDALGGVELEVPQRMLYSDPEQDLYIDLWPGYQTLNGSQAEGFVRFRSDYIQADLGRINAQKIFLTALYQKVIATVKSMNVSVLSDLASQIVKNVSTNLSPSDAVFFAKSFLNINLDGINMMTIPGDTAGDYFVINRAGTLAYVNRYFNIYQKEITDSIFDRNMTFCFSDQPFLYSVYTADPDRMNYGEVYSGDAVEADSIEIPFKS